MQAEEILELHRRHAWQPFTQMKLTPDPMIVVGARGVFLHTSDDQSIIDAIGSWWTCIHGHNHPKINARLTEQLGRFEHVMYSGFTHEPAVSLGSRLAARTAGAMPRAFFSDNGSTAVEIALKMAFQFFTNRGQTEKRSFVTLERGYHGDTIGCMSVGARSAFHRMYAPLLFDAHSLPAPEVSTGALKDPALAREELAGALTAMSTLFEKEGEKICALVLEPLIQGAGGMNFYPPYFLSEARRLCDAHDIFLLADEVFTGCGRTGSFFAFEQAGVWPDAMALSKGLTGGYLPLAVTLATERLYQGFYSDDRMHTFFHGHSMTANPLGCAAAEASLDLFDEQDLLGQVRSLEQQHEQSLQALCAGRLRTHVRGVRACGSVAALELATPANYTDQLGWRIWQECIRRGVLLRPIGNVVYLAPPYVISPSELATVYSVLEDVLLKVL